MRKIGQLNLNQRIEYNRKVILPDKRIHPFGPSLQWQSLRGSPLYNKGKSSINKWYTPFDRFFLK